MSRHGRRAHHPHPGQPARPRPPATAHDRNGVAQDAAAARTEPPYPRPDGAVAPELPRSAPAPVPSPELAVVSAAARPEPRHDVHPPVPGPAPDAPSRPMDPHEAGPDAFRPTCTTAQLRRFIKSRPWIPMHELRRRFGIYGGDDDVTPVRVAGTTLFIGLPPPEARLMGELLAGGDVGYELSLDPGAPIVVGVYPMRPVARG